MPPGLLGERIAERADYSRGTFYGNFEGKDEVVRELLEQRTRSGLQEVQDLSRRAASFPGTLELARQGVESPSDPAFLARIENAPEVLSMARPNRPCAQRYTEQPEPGA